MSVEEVKYFLSYTRQDSAFVLKLATELREAGVNLWLDQLDIVGGQRWDRAVQTALETCQGMIAVLSPQALASNNVLDEVSYALDEEKVVIPILWRSCAIPVRLRRIHYIDFTVDYNTGFSQLLKALQSEQAQETTAPPAPIKRATSWLRLWWKRYALVGGAVGAIKGMFDISALSSFNPNIPVTFLIGTFAVGVVVNAITGVITCMIVGVIIKKWRSLRGSR
jgi:hypothetical protein